MKTIMTLKTIPHLAGMLLLTAMAYSANGAAALEQQSIAVPGVRQVEINAPGELIIRPGTEERLTMEAEPHVLQHLESTLQNDKLLLHSKGSFSTQQKIRYVLVIPRLQSLTVRGSARASIGAFRGDALDIELASSGRATLEDVEFDRLTLQVGGAGRIEISGRGRELVAVIGSSGRVDAENFEVKQAEAKVSGAGKFNVNASERLSATVSSAGRVRYKGQPEITQSVSGAGSLKPL